jgi:carboxyl-terminal processing protease
LVKGRSVPWWLGFALVVSALAWGSPLRAAGLALSSPLEQLRLQAEQCERDSQWEKASACYEQILAKDKDRGRPEIKDRYQRCLRRLHQARRFRDTTFRQRLLSLSLDRAFDLYEEVLLRIQTSYVEREKTELNRLFQEGREELSFALGDKAFCQEQLVPFRADAVAAFRDRLRQPDADRSLRTLRDARLRLRETVQAALKELGLNPVAVVLEFACGACNSLDEYSAFLTPGQLGELFAALEGQSVDVGIEVGLKDQAPVIARIVAGSPADLAGLKRDDPILRVGKKPAQQLSVEAVAELLRGEPGTIIELEVGTPGGTPPRHFQLVRQIYRVPSVAGVQRIEEGIGYLQLASFQQATLQEVDDAILRLKTEGMRVLILDLRGNAGGLFQVSIQVVERFLGEGVIVSTRSQLRAHQKTYLAHSGASAWDFPLIVLVDGDTASAAEVVAGALKDNHRATLVGQTTFGKGTLQTVWELKAAPAGLRVTLAKFLSPAGNAYSGRGVTPDLVIERLVADAVPDFWDEPQMRTAVQEARRLKEMLN